MVAEADVAAMPLAMMLVSRPPNLPARCYFLFLELAELTLAHSHARRRQGAQPGQANRRDSSQ